MKNKELNGIIRDRENKVSTGLEAVKPNIFQKKANLQSKLIAFKKLGELHGLTKYIPSQAQEWLNSVYSYNSNYNKLLTIADDNLIRLVKSYVNMKYKRTQKEKRKKKAKLLGITLNKYRGRNKGRYRSLKTRLSVNKIFVAKGGVKHTSTRALVTIFLFKKTDNIIWLKNIESWVKFTRKAKLEKRYMPKLIEKSLKYKLRKLHRRIHFILLKKKEYISKLKKKNILNNEEFFFIYLKNFLNIQNIKVRPSLPLNSIIELEKYYIKTGSLEVSAHWKAKRYLKVILNKNRYLRLFFLNEIKFKNYFLENFRKIASKIYNKDVVFNFVKLKKFYLNSNIYSQVIALKLKRREFGLSKVLGMSLNRINLPGLPAKLKVDVDMTKLQINNLNHKHIYDLLTVKRSEIPVSPRGVPNLWFELILFRYNRIVNPFSLFGRFKLIHRKNQNVRLNLRLGALASKIWKPKKQMARLINFFKNKTKFIKYGVLAGIRVEARGRLTKRFKAARSVYKLKWIGGLRNIDSSYQGLPTGMLRGHDLPNVEYTVLSSKRKIGAYGVKGWVSSI